MKNTIPQSGFAMLPGANPPIVDGLTLKTISEDDLRLHVGTGALHHLTAFQVSSGRYRLRVSLTVDHDDFILACSAGAPREWSSLDELAQQMWRLCGSMKCIAISLTKPRDNPPTAGATGADLADRVSNGTVRQRDQSGCVLTHREKECLAWTLAGKTAWEIGMLLSISERTAAQHLGACIVKLGTVNKHQAANKAAQLGWIRSA